jgi:hypothetical protein
MLTHSPKFSMRETPSDGAHIAAIMSDLEARQVLAFPPKADAVRHALAQTAARLSRSTSASVR